MRTALELLLTGYASFGAPASLSEAAPAGPGGMACSAASARRKLQGLVRLVADLEACATYGIAPTRMQQRKIDAAIEELSGCAELMESLEQQLAAQQDCDSCPQWASRITGIGAPVEDGEARDEPCRRPRPLQLSLS